MAYENLLPGVYPATLIDWSMPMNDYLNQPEVVLTFEFDHDGNSSKMTFKSLLYKKDGDINKKTVNTLNTCEFKGEVQDLNNDAKSPLNNQKPYTITVIKNEKGYFEIDWINDPAMSKAPVDKAEARAKTAGLNLSKFNGALKGSATQKPPAKKAVKNHAPGAKNDDDSELPF